MIEVIATAFAGIALIEASCAGLVHWLRRRCVWLITRRDLRPRIDERGLAAFMEHGWDSELGWVRKPNTRHGEQGRARVRTSYSLNAVGARTNPGYDDRPPEIVAHGDSYTFARQVNDHEAWPHLLSQALGVNVANYGVGNYGLDQAVLRLERETRCQSPKVMLMGVVPETMCRILNVWKHFSEYGNTFGFKPRFVLENGELRLLPNPVDTPEMYGRIDELLPCLAETDYFFANKFKRDMLGFPYALSILRTWRRTVPLMKAALSDRLGPTSDLAFIRVMERNIELTSRLYRSPEAVALFKAICARFAAYAREKNAVPILIMMPQLLDLAHIRRGDHYYRPALREIAHDMTVLDLAPTILANRDPDGLYTHDRYGGHMSPLGNRLIADAVADVCRNVLNHGGKDTGDTPTIGAYPFASGDLLTRPNTYFYTPFGGHTFIDAWQKARDGIGADAAPSEPPSGKRSALPTHSAVDTATLLEHLYAVLATEAPISSEDADWLMKLVKKFETTKRIHRAYDAGFRAVDKTAHTDATLYLRLGEVFEAAYTQTNELPYLNALLKCLDTLSSLNDAFAGDDATRLASLAARERVHVANLLAADLQGATRTAAA